MRVSHGSHGTYLLHSGFPRDTETSGVVRPALKEMEEKDRGKGGKGRREEEEKGQ